MSEVRVPIQDSVGAAMRAVRQNWRLVGLASLIGAGCATLLTTLGLLYPNVFGVSGDIATSFILAGVYVALCAPALGIDANLRQRLAVDTGRAWVASIVVGFFLAIIAVLIVLPTTAIVLVAGGVDQAQLEASRNDPTQTMALIVQAARAAPAVAIVMALICAAILLLLTSRLYLAIPASIDRQRILTLETWSWTKNNMLRISAARLLLLVPAIVLSRALALLAARLFGFDQLTLDFEVVKAFMQAKPVFFVGFTFIDGLLALALYTSFDAALASVLYRALRPPVRA